MVHLFPDHSRTHHEWRNRLSSSKSISNW